LKLEKQDLEDDVDELEKRLESVVQDLMTTEAEVILRKIFISPLASPTFHPFHFSLLLFIFLFKLAKETEAHWRTNDQKKAAEKQLQTASQLFEALQSKAERLEKEKAEKDQEIIDLKFLLLLLLLWFQIY